MPALRESEYIDVTPTWGEVGKIYLKLADSGDRQALADMKPNAKRAFLAATGYQALVKTLTEEQKALATAAICAAMVALEST